MSIIILPKNHAEWLKEREYGIGGSDAAAVLGMSKWKTNEELWEEKTGRRKPEDISDKPYVQYGHDAEPHIRALFALDHPELEVTYESPYKIMRNEEHPFIFCTPDGELKEKATGRLGGLEVKTTEIMNGGQWKQWTGQIPDVYYCQVIHQFIATGWDFIWLCARIKWHTREGELRTDTREYYLDRAEYVEDIHEMREAEITFWTQQVEKGIRPAQILPEI